MITSTAIDETARQSATPADFRSGLSSRSFIGLLLTQLFGATNDNTFRLLVIGICTAKAPPEQSSVVLSAGLACFTLPYLLLAAPAGYLADRFSKRRVIVACKVAEIVIMGAAIGAIYTGNIYLVFFILTLMGSQSALFGPAKMGSIPEMLRPECISAANGVMGLVTIVATVTGVVLGNALFEATKPDGLNGLWMSACALIGVAIVGTLTSLLIVKAPAADPRREFPSHPLRQTIQDLKTLAASRAMLRVALGIAFFWSLGALAQSNILEYGAEAGLLQVQTNPLLAALVVGVGVGSVLAGVWSGGRIELGILPLGAAGMAISAFLLFTVSGDMVNPEAGWTAARTFACLWLFTLGASAGLFDVPLESFMQERSPRESRGAVLAASNFITFAGMLGTAALYYGLRAPVVAPGTDVGPPLASLTRSEAAEVEQTKRRYDEAWNAFLARKTEDRSLNNAPHAGDYLNGAGGGTRAALLRELVEIDQRRRREIGRRPPAVKDYRAELSSADDLEVVRAALQEWAPLFSARSVFLLAGAMTIPIFVYIVCLIPAASIRFFVWLASRTIYRIRMYGLENLPEQGGALLVANHVTWLDGLFLLQSSARPIRMVAHEHLVTGRWSGWLARILQVIPITPGSTASVRSAIATVREALRQGDLVCVFPEGVPTRTGKLQEFKPGVLAFAAEGEAPIIPVYLDGLWGSIFSFHGGRFFWKWPRRWPYPVAIYFGSKLSEASDTDQVRRAVQQLAVQAAETHMSRPFIPPKAFLKNCRANSRRQQVADSLGEELTGRDVLLRTLILRRLLLREVLEDDEKYVGILIPPSAGAVLVNAVMPLIGRIGVNLNYTLSRAELDYCVAECGIRRVLTTRRVMQKLEVEVDAELVYLDDLRQKLTTADKLAAALMAYAMPLGMLERKLGLHKASEDDLLTVIFTSGSTSQPKGVMLTNRNIGSNVQAINEAVHLNESDVLMGSLPFFHSYGYTVTLWTALTLAPKGIFHFSPLDAKIIGGMCGKFGATILLSTPTFLRSYLKRCKPEDFARLEVVWAGAERLPPDLCDAFEEKFGLRPLEAYGATELSPLVAANIPANRYSGPDEGSREGSVGRPVPGVEAKIVHPETGEPLEADQEGMLLVRGPNVMLGYLNHPEKTAEVIRDGWYVTGDIARIDADGFIFITGRLSRFSKIGGEMVPHIKIEEALQRILGDSEGELHVAVSAVPSEKKGERIVVLYTTADKQPEEIRKQLQAAGLPNIFIPTADSFCQVDAIPVLGTGKLDLKTLKDLALQKFGETDA